MADIKLDVVFNGVQIPGCIVSVGAITISEDRVSAGYCLIYMADEGGGEFNRTYHTMPFAETDSGILSSVIAHAYTQLNPDDGLIN